MSGGAAVGGARERGSSGRMTFFAIHENRGRLFTILKNRVITYTYMGEGWERGRLENPWGYYS